MEYGFTTAAYVVAAILFILSLGGLSGQESAKRAVWYGIAGMALAIVATMIGPGSGNWFVALVLLALGGAAGWTVAQRVQMTEMPQLVAAMHSLVGLAAVFIGFNAEIEMARVAGMLMDAGISRCDRWRARWPARSRTGQPDLFADVQGLRAEGGREDAARDHDPPGRGVPWRLHRGRDLHGVGDRLRQAGGQGRHQGHRNFRAGTC